MLHPITGRRHGRLLPVRASRAKDAVGANFAQRYWVRRLFTAVGDPLLKGAEGRHLHERILPVVAVDRRQVNEAHAILEGEGRVAKPGRRRLLQLLVDVAYELL